VVLDTNILISILIVPAGPPDQIYQAWRDGRFILYTSEEQLDEFRRVRRYPRVRRYVTPAAAGTMLNELRQLADLVKPGFLSTSLRIRQTTSCSASPLRPRRIS
jgi:hypothetical protein